jgi:hypothetical protein
VKLLFENLIAVRIVGSCFLPVLGGTTYAPASLFPQDEISGSNYLVIFCGVGESYAHRDKIMLFHSISVMGKGDRTRWIAEHG